jgi:hypothetical protein
MTSTQLRKLLQLMLAGLIGMLASPDTRADLTLIGHSTVMSLNIPVISQETLYIKGSRLRRDVVDRGRAYSYIYDPNAKQIAVLDHALHQVQIHSMTALAGDTDGKINSHLLKFSATPTGRMQTLQTWHCAEHKLSIVMPAQLGADAVTLTLSGTVWVAHKAAEQAQLAPLLKAAKSPDFFIGIPAFAKNSPAMAGAYSEAISRVGALGTICAADVDASYEGQGRLVDLARRMGTHLGIIFEQFNSEPLDDARFVVPANYYLVSH